MELTALFLHQWGIPHCGANVAAIQSDGKIIVGGFSNNGGNYEFAIVRYRETAI